MKIILLRHEERGFDCTFYSSLTDEGIIRSCTSLPEKLYKKKIDYIFCSPFIRTLQTIFFYANDANKKVNLEYGLYEYLHNPYFLLGNWFYTYNQIHDRDLESIVNINYKSIVEKNDFSILENEKNLEVRIQKFMNYLLTHKKYKNKTILFVTHKAVINKIKDLYIKKTDLENNFPMGHLEIINI